jgi:hypothetical protein
VIDDEDVYDYIGSMDSRDPKLVKV